jgi:hypothetical protein
MIRNLLITGMLFAMAGCGNRLEQRETQPDKGGASLYSQIKVGDVFKNVEDSLGLQVFVRTNQNGTIDYNYLFDPNLMFSGIPGPLTNGIILAVRDGYIIKKSPMVMRH